MATKVVSTHKVLWPYLLELINDAQFSNAMTILAGYCSLSRCFLLLAGLNGLNLCFLDSCIHHLATVKREAKDAEYNINFEVQGIALAGSLPHPVQPLTGCCFCAVVNIPKPQVLLARLMVSATRFCRSLRSGLTFLFRQILACVPNRRRGLGMAVVQCMGALGPIIHPAYAFVSCS
jgi:hypothetical protein